MLVLDANILIRGSLGKRVRGLLSGYGGRVEFCAPDTAIEEARRNLPKIVGERNLSLEPPLEALAALLRVVHTVEPSTYESREAEARGRLALRDESDWPVLACALALGCPIWTEDRDFFGCGVATWTTDRVELYLSASEQ